MPHDTRRSADDVRQSFIDFFTARDHAYVPSASLIPHDPTLLFNVAGMVPFKPYFLGDEKPPYKRAVSSQKCVRAGGKHNDLDDVGRTKRHLVFFEMLGNFSFGDYFKEYIIPASWELVTEVWGMDGDRLWITVHESDDEAEAIWHEQVGVPDGPDPATRRRRELLAGGRDRSVRPVQRDPHRPRRRVRPRRRARATTSRATGSWSSGTSSSCSTTVTRPARSRRCRASRRSTPAPASNGSPCCCRASTRCGRPT